jgi:hypothetical protein
MHREIARNNGERIIAHPSAALDAVTRQRCRLIGAADSDIV